jgi:uncharacterized protein (DUF4415 family)
MSARKTSKPSSDRKHSAKPSRGYADLVRLHSTSEREIARTSPPELADLPPDFWANAMLVNPVPKQAISLRVDADVLRWFRKQGPRYQSRMNAVLRAYMLAAAATRRRPKGAA